MKKILLLSVFLTLILIVSGCAEKKSPTPEGIILFYGDGCPHCGNVEAYIKEHKLTEKLTFDQLEIFNNKDNSNLFTEKAAICQIPQERLGVPLLWDGAKCYEGDQDIIKFFKDKLDEK